MVLTIEPGLYISEDAKAPEQYKGMVFVLKITLSLKMAMKTCISVPKTIRDIEAVMQANKRLEAAWQSSLMLSLSAVEWREQVGTGLKQTISSYQSLIEANEVSADYHPSFDDRSIALAQQSVQYLKSINAFDCQRHCGSD